MKKKMKKRWEGKQKSWLCHHNMSLSSDSFLLWFPPLRTFANKNIWLHPHDSHTYLLMWLSVHPVTVWRFRAISHTQDEQWDIVTLEVTLRHDAYAAHLHAEGWDHTRTFTHFRSHTYAHLKNALSAPKAEQYPECVSRLYGLNAVVAVVKKCKPFFPESTHFDLLDPFFSPVSCQLRPPSSSLQLIS